MEGNQECVVEGLAIMECVPVPAIRGDTKPGSRIKECRITLKYIGKQLVLERLIKLRIDGQEAIR